VRNIKDVQKMVAFGWNNWASTIEGFDEDSFKRCIVSIGMAVDEFVLQVSPTQRFQIDDTLPDNKLDHKQTAVYVDAAMPPPNPSNASTRLARSVGHFLVSRLNALPASTWRDYTNPRWPHLFDLLQSMLLRVMAPGVDTLRLTNDLESVIKPVVTLLKTLFAACPPTDVHDEKLLRDKWIPVLQASLHLWTQLQAACHLLLQEAAENQQLSTSLRVEFAVVSKRLDADAVESFLRDFEASQQRQLLGPPAPRSQTGCSSGKEKLEQHRN